MEILVVQFLSFMITFLSKRIYRLTLSSIGLMSGMLPIISKLSDTDIGVIDIISHNYSLINCIKCRSVNTVEFH